MTKKKKFPVNRVPDPRLRRLITKQTVATEILFLIRNVRPDLESWAAKTIIRAFDEPASFWDQRAHHTLDQWLLTLAELAEKYAQRDAANRIGEPGRKYSYKPDWR